MEGSWPGAEIMQARQGRIMSGFILALLEAFCQPGVLGSVRGGTEGGYECQCLSCFSIERAYDRSTVFRLHLAFKHSRFANKIVNFLQILQA
jgi:hypothetical protein